VSVPATKFGRRSIASFIRGVATGRTTLGAVLQTGASNILIQAAYMGSGVVTARSLGPSGRGSLAAIIMWPQFLAYLMTLGVPAASVFCIRHDPERANVYSAVAMVLSVVMGFAAVAIGLVAIPYSLHTYPTSIIHFARLTVFIAPIALLGITLSTQAQSAGAFRRMNFFRVAQPVMVLAVLLLLWMSLKLNPYTAALAYLLAGIPVTVWNFVWVVKYFRPHLKEAREPVKKMIGYGIRVWGADLLSTVSNQVDRILIIGMLAPRLMGLYVVSQSVAGLLNVLPSAVCTILTPKITGRETPDIASITGSAIRLTMTGMFLAALPLFFGGGLLLHLVYGNKYDGAAVILRILLVEAILDGMTAVSSQGFLAAGVPGTVTLLEGCGLVTALPLMYVMVPRWGLQGAAYALLIATGVRYLLVSLNFPLRFSVRSPSLVLKRSDFRLLERK
jgi:antigen flippase